MLLPLIEGRDPLLSLVFELHLLYLSQLPCNFNLSGNNSNCILPRRRKIGLVGISSLCFLNYAKLLTQFYLHLQLQLNSLSISFLKGLSKKYWIHFYWEIFSHFQTCSLDKKNMNFCWSGFIQVGLIFKLKQIWFKLNLISFCNMISFNTIVNMLIFL